MRRRLWLSTLACALAVLIGACDGTSEAVPTESAQVAPDFPADLEWFNTGGRALSMPELHGKVVLLHFWSDSCVSCAHAWRDLSRLAAEHGGALMILAIHAPRFTGEATSRSVEAAVLRNGVEFPVAADNNLEVSSAWGVTSQPITVIVDPEGTIAGVYSGDTPYVEVSPVVASLIDENDGRLDSVSREFPLEREGRPSTVLSGPAGVVVDGQDVIYIADTAHHRIVAAALPDGDVLAVYGSGNPDLVDGIAQDAAFRQPRGLALSSDGSTLYVADTGNHAVRSVDVRSGSVSTVAGTGALGAWPPSGGPNFETALRSPWDLAVDGDVIYAAMAGSNQLWTIDLAAGRAEPFAGSGEALVTDGPAENADLTRPGGVALDGDGDLYFTDPEASAVRVIDAVDHEVMTVVGPVTGPFAFGDVDGRGGDARFQLPLGLALDGDGLVVADSLNHRLRAVDLETTSVSTLGGGDPGWRDGSAPQFFGPEAVDVVAGTAYVADTGNNVIRIVDLAEGSATTLVLRGIDAFAPTADDVDYRGTIVELARMEVAAGAGSVVLDIGLPANHKVNGDAPSSVAVSVDGGVADVDAVSQTSLTGAEFPVTLPVTFVAGEGSLTADVNLFWCAIDAESLCFIEQVRFVAPLNVTSTGPAQVVLSYQVTLPEIP